MECKQLFSDQAEPALRLLASIGQSQAKLAAVIALADGTISQTRMMDRLAAAGDRAAKALGELRQCGLIEKRAVDKVLSYVPTEMVRALGDHLRDWIARDSQPEEGSRRGAKAQSGIRYVGHRKLSTLERDREMLDAIGGNPGHSCIALMDRFGTDKRTIKRALSRLQGQGLIFCKRLPGSARAKVWYLKTSTKAGAA